MKYSFKIVLFLLFSFCIQSCRIDKIKPNIVLIMADDLGYGDIGCYGNPVIQTPNLDQLASEGIKFMDFHSNGSVCSPTRASLLTGKYPQRTGVEGVITAKDHRQVGLPLAEITGTLRKHRLITLGELADEMIRIRYSCRYDDFFINGIQATIANVFHHSGRK